MEAITAGNREAVDAWNGVLFDRFLQYRHIFTTALGHHGRRAMQMHPPPVGGRVLDIGCGFGDTTQELAGLVGPEGSAVGIDAAERFIELAESEAADAGVVNAGFIVGDVQIAELPGPFDYAFSRMGTMFFANPVAALRNVRQSLEPGARLSMVVWRQKVENPVMYRSEQIVERFIEHPDPADTDEPTCGPGPFSMANADTVSGQLVSAGYTDIDFRRSDVDILQGKDIEEAVAVVTALGPAAEVIRLAGENADSMRAEIESELRELMREFEREDGVYVPTSCWIVSAVA